MAHWRDVYALWFGEYVESDEYLKKRMPFWFMGTLKLMR